MPFHSLTLQPGVLSVNGLLTAGIIPCHGTEDDNAHAGTGEQLG
jgi:hypothetical protein